MPESPGAALEAFVADELAGEAPGLGPIVTRLRERHGDALSAVLFYGSCLRTRSTEGMVDLWVLVDDYPHAYASRTLARANALLPPNVFHLEIDADGRTLRAKVAVISRADFAAGAAGRQRRPQVWARFCQPARIVWARDDAARAEVVVAVAAALRTAVLRGLALVADDEGRQCFAPAAFWHALLGETYASELRTEKPAAIRALYDSAAARHDRALALALEALAAEGRLSLEIRAPHIEVIQVAGALDRARRWRGPRRIATKLLHAAALLKSMFTFGDWLPYALAKLERQTGTRLEASERQRRRPLLYAWPLVWRAVRSRDLR